MRIYSMAPCSFHTIFSEIYLECRHTESHCTPNCCNCIWSGLSFTQSSFTQSITTSTNLYSFLNFLIFRNERYSLNHHCYSLINNMYLNLLNMKMDCW